jgi:hypothetical protein
MTISGFVLPIDTIARGLGWRESDYTPPPNSLVYGLWKYMAQELGPDDYWESEFWNRLQNSWGLELEKILRLIQFIPNDVVERVLNDDWYNDIEGMLAQWFPRTVNGDSNLRLWEEFLGIPADSSLSDSVRRAAIRTQELNTGQSPTVQYMLGIVLRYVNDAVILDQNALSTGTHDNSFIIRILDPSAVPPTDAQMRAAIERFKPATLNYSIQYTETDWLHLAERDWATIGEVDWANLAY